MDVPCHGCELEGAACDLRFKCSECGEVKSVCFHRVGGFDAFDDICDFCDLYLKTGLVIYRTGGSSYGTRPRRRGMKKVLQTTKGEA